MKNKIITIIIILFFLFLYWLLWGRTLTIDIGGKDLDKIVNLKYFEGLYPNMTRTEISEKMGQPTKMDVGDIDKKINYIEIRWIYERPNGSLNYYVEQEDVSGGSVEYIPNNMELNEFLLIPQESLFGKKFIEINNKDSHLITISIGESKRIKKINWYND
jgi:hypothetical protein